MAKFCLVSDIHLAFGGIVIDNTENADCLIMAGDIFEFADMTAQDALIGDYRHEFFKNISDQFPLVLWTPGNHEFYDHSIQGGPEQAKKCLEKNGWGNIKIVNNETVEVKGIPVHCATLWTGMNNSNPVIMHKAEMGMNDYRCIAYNETRGDNTIPVQLRANHTIHEHIKSVQYLKDVLSKDTRDCVVMSHHGPLMQCADTGHGNGGLEYAYASDLSELILDNPHIKKWCYGHTHNRGSIQCGETEVITNARGYYRYESMASTFEPFYFEV